ncbi:Zeaxanthin epoxidase, chloroplastic [Cytospora mali]|uniref:Zeaxanthin epoxidase, chloroplastic n=1 Tax=Cytospora mali TaxID=578113 RepID=A0A194VCD6_CYTMA|nr:Zeaxanthin epoxidase, chloroplastic [Valsa mali var. pyri (nom. inval.)]
MASSAPLHVLIIGGGIVGLTIAQGCHRNGISYTVYEQEEPDSIRQGWALTLHWCMKALERTIGQEHMQDVRKVSPYIIFPTILSTPRARAEEHETVADHTLANDAGTILFLNAATCEVKFQVPPSKNRIRVHRHKFKEVLSRNLDIRLGKKLKSVETLPDGLGVRAIFEDGTHAEGSLLIGADGNNSIVRKHLLPQSQLNRLPLNLIGVVRHFTPEQAAPIRALDPLLFQALDPKTGNYLWYSIQEVFEEPDGRCSLDALVIISWLVRDEMADAFPASNDERIALMKKRTANFAEPLKSIVWDIPGDAEAKPLRMADFVPPAEGWDNFGGRVTLAGDSAHPMTMYRGEGANHGILDAALLVDQLKRIVSGEATQEEALGSYEKEMRERAGRGVLLSRQAALDAHEWGKVNVNSPLLGARVLPETATLQ